jgi:hypothetical protein
MIRFVPGDAVVVVVMKSIASTIWGEAMSNEEQIIDLLREIRDLQKEHSERWQSYVQSMAERERLRELEAKTQADAHLAETRRSTRGIWVIFVIMIVFLFFTRPLGDWILHLFGK